MTCCDARRRSSSASHMYRRSFVTTKYLACGVCAVWGGLAGDEASVDEGRVYGTDIGQIKIWDIKDRVREGRYKNDCCTRMRLYLLSYTGSYTAAPECRSGRVYQ